MLIKRACFILLLLNLTLGLAQTTKYCVEGLESTDEEGLPYKEREGRCEGFYIQKVSSTDIALVSMTAQTVPDFASINPLFVLWPSPSNTNTELRLQAQGIKSRLFYRMDTAKPITQSEFAWKTDVLNSAKIKPQDIGVLGWAEFSQGKVYLPVGLSEQSSSLSSPSTPATYTVLFIPSSELDEVYLAYGFVGSEVKALETFDVETLETQPLGYGYYPAGVPFDYAISVKDLRDTGFYALRLQAVADGTLPVTKHWFFFHEN
jgi:hypothetical protein